MKRVSSSVPSLEQCHWPVSRRASVARRQWRDSGPWHIDLQVSRRLSRRPVVPSSRRFLDQPAVEAFSGGKEGGLIDFYRGSCAIHYIYVSLLFDREH